MYINPFWAGVGAALLTEAFLLAALVAAAAYRQSKNGRRK